MSLTDLLSSDITVSSTLLCPTKYSVHTYSKGRMFTFHISTWRCPVMLCLRSTSVHIYFHFSVETLFETDECILARLT